MALSYGPNARLVQRFLDRIATFTVDDFGAIVRSWRDTLRKSDEWYAAEDGVGEAIARTRRDGEMWVLQDQLYAIFRGAPWYQQNAAAPEVAAQYLATTAAVALMVADALPAEQLRTLYAPFADAIPLAELALGAAPFVEPERAASAGGVRAADDRDGHARH